MNWAEAFVYCTIAVALVVGAVYVAKVENGQQKEIQRLRDALKSRDPIRPDAVRLHLVTDEEDDDHTPRPWHPEDDGAA